MSNSYKSLTYQDFLQEVSEKKFFICLDNEYKYNGFEYNVGLNINSTKFKPYSIYDNGGLYFTTPEHLLECFMNGLNIAFIQLEEDALFYKEQYGNKYKTNKFTITKIVNLFNYNHDEDHIDEIHKFLKCLIELDRHFNKKFQFDNKQIKNKINFKTNELRLSETENQMNHSETIINTYIGGYPFETEYYTDKTMESAKNLYFVLTFSK
jgi:hypothetical protein